MVEPQKKIDSWLTNLVYGVYPPPLRRMEVEFQGGIMDSQMFFKLTTAPETDFLESKCIFTTELFSALCELSPLLRYEDRKFTLHVVGEPEGVNNDDVILMLTEHMGISLTRNRLYCLQGLRRSFAKMDLVGDMQWDVIGRVSVGTADCCQLCNVAFTPTGDLLPRSVLLSRNQSVFPNIPKMTQDAIRNVSEFLVSTFCEFEQAEISVDFTLMLTTDEDYGVHYEYSYSGSFRKLLQVYSVDIKLNRHSSSPWDSVTSVLVQKHEWGAGTQPPQEELKFVKVTSYSEVY